MKKKLFIGCFLLIIVLTGCQQDNELEKVTLVLDYTPNTNHSGIYLAKEQGFYEEVGLDLEIIQPSEGSAESLISANKAEFGISYGENVAQFNSVEEEITSIMGLVAHNTSGFLSRAEKGITRPKDLENKTYCGWGSEIEKAIIESVVKADGGNPDLVNISSSIIDLKLENGPCDVAWAYEGWDKIDMELSGIDINYIPLTDYGLDWYTPVIISSNSYISENDDIVNKFVQATIKGYELAITDPKLASDALLDNAPELSPDLVVKSQEFLSTKYQDELAFGMQSDEIWEQFMSWLKANEIISDDVETTNMYTNKYIETTE